MLEGVLIGNFPNFVEWEGSLVLIKPREDRSISTIFILPLC